jgi:hypothetical protein
MMPSDLRSLFGRKLIDCLTWLGYDNGKPFPTVIFYVLSNRHQHPIPSR